MRVVGFVGMRHDAVGQRGIDWCCGKRRADHSDGAVAAMLADITLRRLTGRQFRPGNHRREGIEQVMLGEFGDFIRERARCCAAHIGAERAHDRTGCLRENTRRRQAEHQGGGRRHAENAASIHYNSGKRLV